MVPLCTFVHPSGKTCASPAVRGRGHCYFHNPARRVSGPRRPTTRPGYRWYSFSRKISRMRLQEAVPVWCQLVEAVINHEIPRERLFRIFNRYNRRVMALRTRMRLPEAPSHRTS